MGWKNWPYWLKGGAIGGIIVILFTIILFIFGGDYRYSPDQMVPKWTLVITYPLGFLVKVSEFIDLNTNFLQNFYLLSIIALVFYFIIGAVIGWIVSKIKNR